MNGLSAECRKHVGPGVKSDVDSQPTSFLAAHSQQVGTQGT